VGAVQIPLWNINGVTPMKTFREFCDGVVKEIPRATGREKEDIRWELTDHLLEHRDMLVEHGYDELEAERRAIEAMGDPVEIGRAWNEKLSPFWLWAGRICLVLFVLILWDNLSAINSRVGQVFEALEVRYAEDAGTRIDPMQGCDLLWEDDPEIEQQFGEHIIRIHRVELWEDTYQKENFYILRLYFVTYHEDLLGHSLSMHAFDGMKFEGGEYAGGGAGQTKFATWIKPKVEVEKGQKTVSMSLDYNGNHFEADIEIDWRGEAA